MSLSKDLISQFVKATKDTTTVKKESTVYGTVVKYNEKTYVKIDGSDLLTPAETLSSVEEGERVSIMIKDHTATITGNYTAPSASSIKVDGMDADLKANTADIKNLVAKNAEIENLVASKATIEDLRAANAEIDTLKADYAEIETLVADKASIGDLAAVNADIKSLKADKADIAHLEANYATIGSLNAVYADVTRLEADKANIKDLEANYATIESLEANYATINQLESNYATIKQLDAANANITNLQTETANINTALIDKANVSDLAAANAVINDLKAGKADIGDLSAANAKIADLEAGKADISVLEANYATIKQLDATNANVTNLQTETANINKALIDKADVSDLNATNANITNLQATKANVSDLNATNANVNTLTGNLADITTLVNGNLTSDNIQSMVITGDKFTVEDGFIKNAMIDTVNASKINTGILNTNNVSIQSNDGSMILQGNLQQFKDKNGKVRIQIGKDATGNFTFVLYDENGTGQLINQNGIQSSNAIADGLIVDSKVADNANIAGSKLDIDSVVTEVNNGTTSIKGTKIYLDDQKQSLNVAFNNMSTTVKGNTNTIQSHTTSINTMNGKVTKLISDTTITKQDGTTTSLKDAYNATVDTVDSHSTKIGSLETNLATANNNISSVSSKQSALEQNLNGFKQTVSETYTTKAEFNDLNVGGRNLFKGYPKFDTEIIIPTYTATNPPGSFKQLFGCYTIDPAKYVGKQFTVSFWAKSPNGNTELKVYNRNLSPRYFYFEAIVDTALGNTWKYYSYTFTNTDRGSSYSSEVNAYNKIEFYAKDKTGVIVKNIKVEFGNKATDWMPAPEDIDSAITKVDGKFTNYSTTSQMNSAITQKANEITSTVSETYATKASLTTVDNKFANYSTTSAMNSAINQKANEITSTVSETYATKTSVSDVSNNLKNNYSTTSAMNSAINQKANEITSTVSEIYATKTSVSDVSNNLKNNYSTTTAMNSAINQKGDSILSTVSSTYTTKADFNNLNIGGRNLLKNTKPTVENSGYGLVQYLIADKSQIVSGDTYTISFDGMLSDSAQTHFYFNVYSSPYPACIYISAKATDGNYHHYTGTFKMPSNSSYPSIGVYSYPLNNKKTSGIKNVKLEKGNKATDWSPAPEDIDASIATVDSKFINYSTTSQMNSAINQKANEITSTVSETYATKTALNTVDGKFANYSTTTAMNSAINQKANEITSTVSETYATKSALNTVDNKFANYSTTTAMNSAINQKANEITSTVSQTYATKTALSTVDNKFANYSTTSAMNSAINQKSDSILSTVSNTYATKTALNTVDGKFANYSTTTAMNSAINQKSDAILSTVSSTYTTKADFNDLSVGGRNLFKGYPKFDQEIVIPTYTVTNPPGSFKQFYNSITIDPAKYVGKQFTISFWAKSPNGNTALRVYNTNGSPRYFYFGHDVDTALGNTWKYYSYTFTNIDRGSSYGVSNKIEFYAPSKTGVIIKNIKLEFGNKATDWSPAPEDIDSAITTVDNKFANYSTTSQMNSAINQKANEITSTVSNTYATKTALNTVDGKFANYSTTSAMNTAINQKADSILSTVSGTYATKTALNTVDGKFANYSTTSAMNSAINQKSDSILSTVSNTYATKTALNTVDGKFANYSTTTAMNSAINQKSDAILSTVSSTYTTKADFNDLSVGGRNLFKGYPKFDQEIVIPTYTVTNPPGSFGVFYNITIDPAKYVGKQFTISFWAKSPNGNTKLRVYNTNGSPRYFYFGHDVDTALGNTWKYYSYTFTNTDRGSSLAVSNKIEIYAENKSGVIVKNIKLEFGNKATDWSPAPEDIDSAITKVDGKFANYSTTSQMNSAINQKANEITSTVSNTYATKTALNTVDGKFANYSTTSAMNTAINQKADSILSTVSGTYATKTALNTVDGKFANYSTTTAMNSAINQKGDSILSTVSSTYATKTALNTVDGKFANYSTTTAMNSAINQKGDSILSTVSNTYTTKADFNDLNVGGRNLFKGYPKFEQEITIPTYTVTNPPGSFGVFYNITIDPAKYVGKQFTISFWAKSPNGNTALRVYNTNGSPRYFYFGHDVDTALGNTWKYYSYTFTNIDRGSSYGVSNKIEFYAPSKTGVIIKNIKLEFGNKATDWSPAPEDIDSAITTVDNKFANYSTTTQMNTAINQKAESITQSVSSTYATKTSLDSANKNITSLTNRMSNAESKLTKDSLTTTIGSYYTTSTDVNGLITTKGYATTSEVSQTATDLTAKFSSSGGHNLLRNSDFSNGLSYWTGTYHTLDPGSKCNGHNSVRIQVSGHSSDTWAGIQQVFATNVDKGRTYTASLWYFVRPSDISTIDYPFSIGIRGIKAGSTATTTIKYTPIPANKLVTNKWTKITETITTTESWTELIIYPWLQRNGNIWIADIQVEEGSIATAWSPHPYEIYDGITQINKDGIKVYHISIDSNSYTHMSPTGFYLKNKGTDIFKVDANGLYIKGNGDFTGKVTANDGSIGGFTISNGKLVGTGGNGVGMSGNGTDWAFWAGSSTGGNAPFHVGHEGNLYATQAYITGTITGSTINAGTINGATINSDSFVGDMLAIDGTISAKSLQVQDIDNAKYPGAVTADFKLYVSTSGNDDSEIENGATFATFDGLLDKLPKNLNGHEVRIEMSTNITENVDFKGFFGGKIRLYMKGHTLYGYVVSRMGSARINICSGYIGNASDTSNGWGKIHPSKGYAVSSYTTTVASVDQGAIGLYNIDVYGADNYLSGSTTKLGVAGQDWGTAYLNGVSYYGCDMGARANAGGRIHDVLSYNVCTKYGFYATTGGYITLAGSEHSGGKSKNYHEADAGKVIVASGATFASGEASVPGGSAPVVPTTKTITIKSTYGDTYRSSVYNSWKKDGTVRQGDYGYGDCNGCWFFGDAFSDVEGKTISKVTIKITRQSGGSSSAVGLVVKSHGYSGRPSGKPSYRTTAGTLSLATGASGTLTITNSTILNEIKSGAVKGFGIQTTYDSSHYAVCSGSVTVKITYTE